MPRYLLDVPRLDLPTSGAAVNRLLAKQVARHREQLLALQLEQIKLLYSRDYHHNLNKTSSIDLSFSLEKLFLCFVPDFRVRVFGTIYLGPSLILDRRLVISVFIHVNRTPNAEPRRRPSTVAKKNFISPA